jgi:quinol monooxygenase YgiN
MTDQSVSQLNAAPPANRRHRPTHGLLVTLDAKSGKQEQVANVLHEAFTSAVRESGTITWYAYRITETKFGIFDTFFDDDARQVHLSGNIGRLLEQISDDALLNPPSTQTISIVASKL